MREHQIIITLKPDQFLQVQRLARMSGAKSMGMFVRKKLLSSLGIEGESDTVKNSVDLQPTISELKRLHSELRGFVAESLAIYLSEQGNVSNSGTAVHGDEAFSTFGPRSVPPDEVDEAPMDGVDAAHSEKIAGLQAQTPEQAPPPINIAEDELERLAERTFAISPRLGAIGTDSSDLVSGPVPAARADNLLEPDPARELAELRDPLTELLDGADLPGPADDTALNEDDEAFVVPLAIQERRKQLAKERQSAIESRPDEAITSVTSAEAVSTDPVAAEDEFLEKDITTTPADPQKNQPSSTTTEIQAKAAPDAGSLGNQTGGPVSGGPPPKRRKS